MDSLSLTGDFTNYSKGRAGQVVGEMAMFRQRQDLFLAYHYV